MIESDSVNDFMVIHPRESMLSTESPTVSSAVSLSEQAQLRLHKWLWQDDGFKPIIIR